MSADPHLIMLVEDDTQLRDLVCELLTKEGWRVAGVRDAKAMEAAWALEGKPDLLLLDINLPGEDGLSIARRISTATDVAIMMLTARAEDVDRILGLEIGADDYLSKPFHPRELIARVRALLRHRSKLQAGPGDRIVVADLAIDPAARTVERVDGCTLKLTGAEFDLLLVLAQARGRVLSRDHLLDRVHGRVAHPSDRAIDVLVSRLRRKIDGARGTSLIESVRNVGYVLRDA